MLHPWRCAIALIAGLQIFASASAKAWTHEVMASDATHLEVALDKAKVQITGGPGPLKISTDVVGDGQFDWTQSGDVLKVSVKPGVANAGVGNAGVGNLEISGRPVALSVHVAEGHVNLQKWTSEVLVQLLKGPLHLQDNACHAVLVSQKGDIIVRNHVGKLWIDSFQSGVQIHDIKGDLEVQNFGGEASIEKVSGGLTVTNNSGAVKIQGGGGTLNFENLRGNWQVSGFQGRVEGQNTEGHIAVAMAGDEDINIRSSAGPVHVTTPAGSGALLNLTSTEGEIYVPAYLKVNHDGSTRSLRGRLKGEGSHATIFVRTGEGVISVK